MSLTGLLNLGSTAGSSNHWTTYIASAEAKSQPMVTTQGQAFAISNSWCELLDNRNGLSTTRSILLYKSLFVTSHYASDWWLLGGKTN